MAKFPACRFVWSARVELPEVGPLLGIDAEPGHGTLMRRLEERAGEEIWADRFYGGWLEVVSSNHYRVSAQPGDGFYEGLEGLSQQERAAMMKTLQRWAVQDGVLLDPASPA